MDFEKIRKKVFKHIAFFLLAFIIANFFLAYIIGIDELKKIISEPVERTLCWFSFHPCFLFYFLWSVYYFREQICTVICPYGRLQSVLLDRNSLVVAYDYKRGEPRGKFKKNQAAEINTGDCIDCFQCVKVCPTGIDIRNGTQMECVGCTACIDACDRIMEAVQKPKGLVRYASENGITEGKNLRYTGRMKFYTVLLILLSGILTLLLISRKDIDGTIIRTKGMVYQERGTDSLSNLFNIKVINKTIKNIPITLRLEGDAGNAGKIELVGATDIHLKQEDQASGTFFVVFPRTYVRNRKMKILIGLYDADKKITTLSTNFAGPFGKY